MVNKKGIIELVATLRNELQLSSPINLDELAEKLNVKVIYESLNSEGYFINYNGKLFIFLNKDTKFRTRQRFTFAHEIGHRLLHIDSPILQRHSAEENRQVNTRELKSLEDEANFFASELLCPTSFLEKKLPNFTLTMSIIEQIALETDISLHAAAIKCVENSKTQNELLMFFNNYQEFKWFTSADPEFTFGMLPKQIDEVEEFTKSIYSKCTIEENTVDGYGTLMLVYGNKKEAWEYEY